MIPWLIPTFTENKEVDKDKAKLYLGDSSESYISTKENEESMFTSRRVL